MPSRDRSFRPPRDVVMPTARDLEDIAIEADREAGAIGPSQMIRGVLVFAAGVAITTLTVLAVGISGLHIVGFGIVMGGLADFIVGFSNWRRGMRARAKNDSVVPK